MAPEATSGTGCPCTGSVICPISSSLIGVPLREAVAERGLDAVDELDEHPDKTAAAARLARATTVHLRHINLTSSFTWLVRSQPYSETL
jgi:hypothetical protein